MGDAENTGSRDQFGQGGSTPEAGGEDPKHQLPVVITPAPLPAVLPLDADKPQTEYDWLRERVRAELPRRWWLHPGRDEITEPPFGRICGLLCVDAQLRDENAENWSVLIRFANQDHEIRSLVVRQSELIERPAEIVSRLANMGLAIFGSARAVAEVLKYWKPADRGWLADKRGWFMRSDEPIAWLSPAGETVHGAAMPAGRVHYGGPTRVGNGVSQGGTLSDWQEKVAPLAVDNPVLIFSICAALAAPLLAMLRKDVIGFFLWARTSSGKTTALKVASSVWFGPGTIMTWNATATALELAAREANDGVLLLDEFPKESARTVVETLYALGNGQGRARSSRKLQLATPDRWRSVILSTAEEALPATLARSNIAMADGLSARFIDVPVGVFDHGIFNELHGHASGQELSDHLVQASADFHGSAGPAFCKWLLPRAVKCRDVGRAVSERIRSDLIAFCGIEHGAASGLVLRNLDHFAAVAAAGEMAIRAGILPWPKRTAQSAVREIVRRKYAEAPTQIDQDVETITDNLAGLLVGSIAEHFVNLEARHTEPRPADFAGWFDDAYLYVERDCFRTAVAGKVPDRRAARILADLQILDAGGERDSLQCRLPASKVPERPRVYRLNRERLAELLGV